MAQHDYYKTLDVAQTATAEQIKKAYRKKAMQLHPDRHHASKDKSKEQLQSEFAQLQEAYGVLSDPQKRGLYDSGQLNSQTGGYQRRPSFNFEDAFDEFDIFGNIFSNQRSTYANSQSPGADLRYTLSLDLEDVVFGCNKTIEVNRLGKCANCNGTGADNQSKPVNCPTCHGKGKVYLQHGPFNIQQACPSCNGQGRYVEKPCTSCRGSGQAREKRTLSIKVPVGIVSGEQIRLRNEGEAGIQGGPAGNLYIQIHIKTHPLFTREDDNLLAQMPVSYTTAALGGELEVPTIDGKVKVHIPKGTPNGKVFRLKKKGVPRFGSYGAGDLLLTLMVEVPAHLNSEQTELLKTFEASLQQSSALHYPSIKQWIQSIKDFFTPKNKS